MNSEFENEASDCITSLSIVKLLPLELIVMELILKTNLNMYVFIYFKTRNVIIRRVFP